MSEQKTITLTVNGTDLIFEPNRVAYNQLLNALDAKNKTGAVRDYLLKIVSPESRSALLELLDANPAAGMQLAPAINDTFAPVLEIEVKK
ncbi:putative phage tail assembly chaperone [Klebsiella michiganensis]|uniref:putative phage tail assembly chaperone n=1 Tax=Klebsiella michiganensis TaxID=1134687 RepID=UPI003981B800